MDTDAWTLIRGDNDGEPFLVRYREFPPTIVRDRYPIRVNLFWSMSEPDDNGLASAAEANRLETFEDRLVAAVESDSHSLLVAALTGKGKREFVFHTADAAGFLQRLEAMPQEAARYPIQVQRYDDEAWTYLESLKGSS